jgi:hypothetical protein
MASTQIVSQQIRDDTIVNADINSAAAIAITKIAQGTANQLIGSNAGATANEYKTLSGTANEITVTQGVGTITLSTPQAIAITSSPTFASETLTGTLTVAGLATFNNSVYVTNALASGTPAAASQINTGDPNTKALILKGNTFTPASLLPNQITGLFAWYKADAIVGLTDGQSVTSWLDSSGNANTLGSVNTAPLYKVNQVNGLPSVVFAGNGTTTGSAALRTGNITLAQPYTVIMVVNYTSSSFFMTAWSSSGINLRGYMNLTASKWGMLAPTQLNSATAETITTYQIAEFIVNGNSSQILVNGTSRASGAAGAGGFSASGFQIGNYDGSIGSSTQTWAGGFAEVIIYSNAISSSDRTNLETYLRSKYNIGSGVVTQVSNLEENQSAAGTVLSAVDASGRYVLATSAGTPSDTPPTGTTVYDTTNHQLDIYDAGWKSIIENALPLTGGTLTGALTLTSASIKNNAAQTTITGTAGTALCSQPEQGTTYKVVIIYLAGYTNSGTQNYTYPTAFVNTPVAIYTTAGATPTIGLTTVSIASTTTTGFVILEGY